MLSVSEPDDFLFFIIELFDIVSFLQALKINVNDRAICSNFIIISTPLPHKVFFSFFFVNNNTCFTLLIFYKLLILMYNY